MKQCKKCGSEEIATNYFKPGDLITSSAREKSTSEFIHSSEYDYYWKLTAYKEHLRLYCNDCGHIWLTRCHDSD